MVSTITISTPTGGTLTLSGDNKATVTGSSIRKESNLTPMPLYMQDSDETDVYDFGGATKTIMLKGRYYSATAAEVLAFVAALQGLLQGQQDTMNGYPLTYTNADTEPAIKVKVQDLDITDDSEDPLSKTWTLRLVQSSQLA
jgi:hypothetical protein